MTVTPHGMEASGADIDGVVAMAWAHVLPDEAPDLATNFFDVGGTSLLLYALHRTLEDCLDIDQAALLEWDGRYGSLLDIVRSSPAAPTSDVRDE